MKLYQSQVGHRQTFKSWIVLISIENPQQVVGILVNINLLFKGQNCVTSFLLQCDFQKRPAC